MNRRLVFCLAAVITIQSGLGIGRPKTRQLDTKGRVERAESRPDLITRFDDAAQLKIASRKSNFRLTEMITLDIALLNTSTRPLFFRRLSELRINVLNSDGQPTTVQEYGVPDRAVVPMSFVHLAPGEIIVHSFHLLVGCDKRAFVQTTSTEDDDLAVFKNGRFLNWGDACLPNTEPQTYSVSAELQNNFVLSNSGKGDIKTAVGTIKSNSLEMTIGN